MEVAALVISIVSLVVASAATIASGLSTRTGLTNAIKSETDGTKRAFVPVGSAAHGRLPSARHRRTPLICVRGGEYRSGRRNGLDSDADRFQRRGRGRPAAARVPSWLRAAAAGRAVEFELPVLPMLKSASTSTCISRGMTPLVSSRAHFAHRGSKPLTEMPYSMWSDHCTGVDGTQRCEAPRDGLAVGAGE